MSNLYISSAIVYIKKNTLQTNNHYYKDQLKKTGNFDSRDNLEVLLSIC